VLGVDAIQACLPSRVRLARRHTEGRKCAPDEKNELPLGGPRPERSPDGGSDQPLPAPDEGWHLPTRRTASAVGESRQMFTSRQKTRTKFPETRSDAGEKHMRERSAGDRRTDDASAGPDLARPRPSKKNISSNIADSNRAEAAKRRRRCARATSVEQARREQRSRRAKMGVMDGRLGQEHAEVEQHVQCMSSADVEFGESCPWLCRQLE
jgi:hypothetical protein